jgi:hypothetical protein
MASIKNKTSFWATEPSLLWMFAECGFESVTAVEPPHYSKYGPRKFYIVDGSR